MLSTAIKIQPSQRAMQEEEEQRGCSIYTARAALTDSQASPPSAKFARRFASLSPPHAPRACGCAKGRPVLLRSSLPAHSCTHYLRARLFRDARCKRRGMFSFFFFPTQAAAALSCTAGAAALGLKQSTVNGCTRFNGCSVGLAASLITLRAFDR